MKPLKWIIICIVICLCCSAVVYGATTSLPTTKQTTQPKETPVNSPPPMISDSGISTKDPENTKPIESISGDYTNYEVYWVPGVNGKVDPGFISSLQSPNDIYVRGSSLYLTIKGGRVGYVYLPIPNIVSHNGKHPMVKTLVLCTTGDSKTKLQYVSVMDGYGNTVKGIDSSSWDLTGYKEHKITLNSYKDMVRGITIVVAYTNTNAVGTVNNLYINSAGAQGEWN